MVEFAVRALVVVEVAEAVELGESGAGYSGSTSRPCALVLGASAALVVVARLG
ncbi:MAG TPA: hypothetical protein VKB37_12815 [Jatrophihabitantaceae bacterium]|nr:hypothetical protein [Jatrophihabitantaceae bacterium]